MSRTAPRLVDLCAALATGLAGAFAIGRKDISDTLPGVAIAISLVPPLANVGILLAAGRPDLAVGSLLLFVTNFLAILLTGSIMFGLMGFPRAALTGRSPRSRRVAVFVVVVLVLLIAVPLGAESYSVTVDSLAESRAAAATTAWLDGSGYRLVSSVADKDVQLVVTGEGALPNVGALEQALKGRLFGMRVTLQVVKQQRASFETR